MIESLLNSCCFYGHKMAHEALTEYEMLMYESMCNSVTEFCKLQTKKLQIEINETVDHTKTEA